MSSADQTEIRNPRLDSLLARIAETIGPVRCELWFGEPGRIDWNGTDVTFHFESDFEMNRVQRHHGIQLREAVQSLVGPTTCVRFVIKPNTASEIPAAVQPEALSEPNAQSSRPKSAQSKTGQHAGQPHAGQPIQEPHPQTGRQLEQGINGLRARVQAGTALVSSSNSTLAQQPTRSNRGFELDEFWFGPENQLAETAVRENFAKPGHFSPLLLYGPSGVGKTHLLDAICRRFRSLGVIRSYVCLTAEQFLNEFLSGLKSSGLPTFRTKFRDLDLFAIDDIQYLAGKPGTINELNLTLDNLIKKGKQIILTTDRAPLELGQISPELGGRLQGGLNCPLVYPSMAGRRWILDSICRQRSWSFSSDVLDFVAEGIDRDCRRLVGALNRLRAVELSTGQLATRASAERDLKDLVVMGQAVTTLPKIEQLVCEACGVPASELRSEKRTKRISSARMLAMWLSRQHTGNALSEIGDYFGGRSHSTVVAAHKRVEQWFESGEQIELQSGSLPIREAVQLIVRRLRVG